MVEIEKTEPTALNHLDFVVDAFRKAIAGAMIKVVQDVRPPIAQGISWPDFIEYTRLLGQLTGWL